MMPRIDVAKNNTRPPPIGSTIPLNVPMQKDFQREFPAARSGIDIIAPSGMFWIAIPNERASAPATLKSAVRAPASATPTAIPSGKLWMVTANVSLAVLERRL